MQRHVRQHRLHQRLVGQMLLEHAAVTRVMQRMRQSRSHQAGGSNRAILPRQLHHLDDGADALALVADALGIGAGEFDFGRRVGAVAELVLQPLKLDRVDRAIGAKRGMRKQLSPSSACASTRKASHIGADMNHLCPVMR